MPVQLTLPDCLSTGAGNPVGSGGGSDLPPAKGRQKPTFFAFRPTRLQAFVLFIVFAAERLEVPKHSFSPQLSRSLTFELDFAGVFWLVLWSCLSVIMLCLHAV